MCMAMRKHGYQEGSMKGSNHHFPHPGHTHPCKSPRPNCFCYGCFTKRGNRSLPSYLSSGYLSQSLSAYLSISKMLNTSQFILTHTAVPFLRTLLQYTHTSMKSRIREVPCCHKRLEITHMVRTRQLVE